MSARSTQAGVAVVLAAGQSSRMGSIKALLDAGDGRPLIRATCAALLDAGLSVIVVLGHHREAVQAALAQPGLAAVQTVINPAPDRGQVSSLALGLRAAADAGARQALVALVDQPPVRSATLRALLDAAAAEPQAVHVPTWRGRRGHPASFPTTLAAALEQARSGEGARDVVTRVGVAVREHPVDDAGVLLDLDTPEDVASWRAAGAPPQPSPTPQAPAPSPLAPGEGAIFAEAARRAGAREPFALCTVITTHRSAPREAGAKMLVAPDGSIAGTVGGGPLEASVVFEAARLLRDGGGSAVLDFALSAAGDRADVVSHRQGATAQDDALALGMKCGGEVSVFIDLVRPSPRLLVYGAGHVGERVATVAAETGWHTVVIDDRPAFATRERFPRAADVRCADLGTDPLGGLDPGPEDYVVIVTRCHDLDEGVLQAALQCRARYVGLIGSRRKVAVILRSIERRTGLDPRRDPRLHAPIGLRLGDKTPGEIAISILAEVLLIKSAGALEHSRLAPKVSATSVVTESQIDRAPASHSTPQV